MHSPHFQLFLGNPLAIAEQVKGVLTGLVERDVLHGDG
jgi:hypothetical protein